MYKRLLRPLLFRIDPERIHHISFRLIRILLLIPGMRALLASLYTWEDPGLERELFGLRFKNPVGLAAGFDKDGIIGADWRYFGFGFVEVGTVTPRPQAGNDRPRLFRLPKDMGIINRMGFNNAGLEALQKRLKRMRKQGVVVGANIGKNKDTPNEQAAEDYLLCFEGLADYVDYFVVNVSSPNTPGLRALQEKEPLRKLLQALQTRNASLAQPKPLLLKISPDLSDTQLDDVIAVAKETQLAGLVATNTTLSRQGLNTSPDKLSQIGAGGLSGLPLTGRAWEVLAYLQEKTQGSLPLIGVGGIMEPLDAKMRLEAGASLIQVYSGFVYGGPGFVRRILKSLSHAKRPGAVHLPEPQIPSA